jgi:hypothetical protein
LPHLLVVLAAGTAIASFIYEVAWIRMLSLVLGSSTHAFELMLSAFILGLALGALWIRTRADRFANPLRTLVLVQVAMGALAMASLPLYLESFDWTAGLLSAVARTPSGYTGFTIARYAICLAIMLPATFCAGMTLPLMTRMLLSAGAGERAIGAIYGANTLGSILGVGFAALALLPLSPSTGSLMFGASLDIVLVLLVATALLRAGQSAGRLVAAGTAVLVVSVAGALVLVPWDPGRYFARCILARLGRTPCSFPWRMPIPGDRAPPGPSWRPSPSGGPWRRATPGEPPLRHASCWRRRVPAASGCRPMSSSRARFCLLPRSDVPRRPGRRTQPWSRLPPGRLRTFA